MRGDVRLLGMVSWGFDGGERESSRCVSVRA